MRFNSHLLVLAAVSAGALAPAAASARPIDSAPQHGTVQVCGKDYSRNSVTGDYCAPAAGYASPASRPAAVPVSAPAPAEITVKHDSGFSWGDAGAGAGGAIVLLAVTAGGAIALRRRSPTPS
jgi:hypothetical protein